MPSHVHVVVHLEVHDLDHVQVAGKSPGYWSTVKIT
jgi:hypothetical protein